MLKKFNMSQGLVDAANHLVKGWNKYLIPALLLGLSTFTFTRTISIVTNKYSIPLVENQYQAFNEAIVPIILIGSTLLIYILFVLIMQTTLIKVTDDLIEDRISSFREQFLFVLKRLGRILLANIIAGIPILLLLALTLGSLFRIGRGGLGIYFLGLIGIVIYVIFIAMINQSIIIHDVSSIRAISNSIRVMKNNFFRYLFAMLGLGIANAIITNILSGEYIVIVIISAIVSTIITTYFTAFNTSLYKQVTKPLDHSEILDIDTEELELIEDYE